MDARDCKAWVDEVSVEDIRESAVKFGMAKNEFLNRLDGILHRWQRGLRWPRDTTREDRTSAAEQFGQHPRHTSRAQKQKV